MAMAMAMTMAMATLVRQGKARQTKARGRRDGTGKAPRVYENYDPSSVFSMRAEWNFRLKRGLSSSFLISRAGSPGAYRRPLKADHAPSPPQWLVTGPAPSPAPILYWYW